VSDATALDQEIKSLIRRAGPMPVWRYMQLCLTHPQHGYYIARDPLGRAGDFITAPEISQMFGELIGLWAASVWRMMGDPAAVNLIELGPGRGTMMADALRAIRVLPEFLDAISVHLVEVNPRLRETQRQTLNGFENVTWHTGLDQLPPGPSIILANEYFDVLPIHQMVKRDTGWHERVVEIDRDGELAFGTAREPTPRFAALLPPHIASAPSGSIFEWRPDTEMMTIARHIRSHGGAALIIDYGHTSKNIGDTLQAIKSHAFADVLQDPGTADLTAHVDFQALAQAAEAAGIRSHGPVEQGIFLHRLGIEARAKALMAKATPAVAQDIMLAYQRLTGGSQGSMGGLFKVLGVADPSLDMLVALSDAPPEAKVSR